MGVDQLREHVGGELEPGETRLTAELVLSGLDLDRAQTPDASDDVALVHVHVSPPGNAGPIVFTVIPNGVDNLDGDLGIDAPAGRTTFEWDANEGSGGMLLANWLAAARPAGCT